MPTLAAEFTESLKREAPDFGVELPEAHYERLANYYELLLRWNPRLHLVAPCAPQEFAIRHVLESLTLLKHLPPRAEIVDVGSGAGLPSVPCLLVRDDLRATLIESSRKKGIFLNEVLRAAQLAARARLVVSRFEDIAAPLAGFVTCRALDRFSEMLPQLVQWAPAKATFLLFVGESLRDQLRTLLDSVQIERIPHSEKRFLMIGRKET